MIFLWEKGKTTLFAMKILIEEGITNFILRDDALNVIKPIACSLSLPHWAIAKIIANIINL